MTAEQLKKEFDEMIAKNGFTISGYTSDTSSPIYHRVWLRQDDILEARVLFSNVYTLVTIKRNGIVDGDLIRDYKNPKQAMRVMREFIHRAGYEW